MEHSILSPSGAEIWTPCPGSLVLSVGVPDDETDDQREGEATHWVGESCVRGRMGDAKTFLGVAAPNGVIITQEMVDCASLYARRVLSQCSIHELHVEERIEIPRVHELCFGTPDCWWFDAQTWTVHLKDYKHGHASVTAVDKDQLIIYVAGIMDHLKLTDYEVNVVAEIVQPRCYDGLGTYRTWSFNGADIRGRINQIAASAVEALGPDPSLHAGKHCRYCAARHRCPTLQQFAMEAIDYSQTAVPQDLDDASLAYELHVLDRARAAITFRQDALEGEALARIRDGKRVPGFSARQGLGNNKWVMPAAEVFDIGDMLGLDLRAAPSAITPGQAIDLCKSSSINPEVLTGLFDRKKTAFRLVADDESEARRVFNQQNTRNKT